MNLLKKLSKEQMSSKTSFRESNIDMDKKLSQRKSYLTILFNIGFADGCVDGAEKGIIHLVAGRMGLSEKDIEECFKAAQTKSELKLTDDLEEQVLLILDAFVVAAVTDGIDSNEIKILTKLCSYLGLCQILDEIEKLSKENKAALIMKREYRESLAAKFKEDLEEGQIKRSKASYLKNKPAEFVIN